MIPGSRTRSWLLQIVRNTAYTQLERRKKSANVVPLEDAARRRDRRGRGHEVVDDAPDAEARLIKADEQAALGAALAALPLHLRATVEIAAVMAVPVGTVMSRLARAREQLRRRLTVHSAEGGRNRAPRP